MYPLPVRFVLEKMIIDCIFLGFPIPQARPPPAREQFGVAGGPHEQLPNPLEYEALTFGAGDLFERRHPQANAVQG